MRHQASGHLDDGVLLRYLDGELTGREMRRARAHLEACWQCRCAREALESTVADCIEYRRKVLAAGLPEPPGGPTSRILQRERGRNALPMRGISLCNKKLR